MAPFICITQESFVQKILDSSGSGYGKNNEAPLRYSRDFHLHVSDVNGAPGSKRVGPTSWQSSQTIILNVAGKRSRLLSESKLAFMTP